MTGQRDVSVLEAHKKLHGASTFYLHVFCPSNLAFRDYVLNVCTDIWRQLEREEL